MKVNSLVTYQVALVCACLCLCTAWLGLIASATLPERDHKGGYTRGSLPSPIECDAKRGCTLANHQGTWTDRTPCKAAKAVFPRTEAELVSAVAQGVKEGIKMKVVTEIGHSTSKLACPEGENGLLISTRDYVTEPVYVNKTEMSASVDAGMQLREFIRALALQRVTIPHTPLWDGVSIGGAIATGSHGSGFFGKGSVISEYVTAVRIVVTAAPEAGYAKVITIRSGDEALKAVKMSLGVLGIVSKVTFAVMPMFKRSLSLSLASDNDFEDQILPFSQAHHFASLFWIPSSGKVLYKEENAVSVHETGDGANMFPLVQPMLASQIQAMRAQQEAIETSRDVAGLCIAGEKMVEHRMKTGDGYTNSAGGRFESFPIVGFNHRMQTAGGCQVYKPFVESSSHIANEKPMSTSSDMERVPNYLEKATSKTSDVEYLEKAMSKASGVEKVPTDLERVPDVEKAPIDLEKETDWWTCKWDPRLQGVFYYHTAIAIPLANVASFIKDVKKLRDVNPQGMCVLNMFGGIHVRFVSSSDAYLGDLEDSAVFELVYYRAREKAQGRLYQDVMEEIEQMMVRKYKGRPHWGKNRNVAFQGAWKKVVSMDNFLRVKAELDPDNLFSSAWSDELLGLHHTFSKLDHDNCALDGLCFCHEDRHCSPSTGYTCQHGLIFKEARVCRLIMASSS